MNDVKRHIAEEWLVLVGADEIHGVLHNQIFAVTIFIGAIIEVVPPAHRTASTARLPGEVIHAASVINPGLVEAVRVHAQTRVNMPAFPPVSLKAGRAPFGRVGVFTVMPFAEDAGAVAVGLEAFGNGGLILGEFAAGFGAGAHAKGMTSGHQHGAGGRTNAPAHVVAQLDALFEQMIDVRRRDESARVCADVAPAHIVTQKENDIGFG